MSEELNKSSCGIPIELLSAYIDDELDKNEYEKIKAHLKSCAQCQKIVEEFKEIDAQLRKLEIEEPSRAFNFALKRNVMERIGKRKKFIFWRFFPVLVPAAVMVLILVIIRSEGLDSPVGMKDRIPYVYLQEEKIITVGKFEIALPKIATFAKSPSRVEPTKDKETTLPSRIRRAPEFMADLESPIPTAESFLPDIGESVVIRAIVDSTGKILNVAKGKSLVPEEDTTILRLFKGKQLLPPKIQGRPTQMFVEFTPEKKESN